MAARTTFPAQVAGMDRARRREYRRLLDFYAGNQWKERAPAEVRRLTLNYARTILDKAAGLLVNDMRMVVDPGPQLLGSEAADASARRPGMALARQRRGIGRRQGRRKRIGSD